LPGVSLSNRKLSKGMIRANWKMLKNTAISVNIKNGKMNFLYGLA
jgi:hypothetical protein